MSLSMNLWTKKSWLKKYKCCLPCKARSTPPFFKWSMLYWHVPLIIFFQELVLHDEPVKRYCNITLWPKNDEKIINIARTTQSPGFRSSLGLKKAWIVHHCVSHQWDIHTFKEWKLIEYTCSLMQMNYHEHKKKWIILGRCWAIPELVLGYRSYLTPPL